VSLDRCGALGHDAVTSDLTVAGKQLSDLLQRLGLVASRVPVRLKCNAHEDHLL
jgi:hypothetical protein